MPVSPRRLRCRGARVTGGRPGGATPGPRARARSVAAAARSRARNIELVSRGCPGAPPRSAVPSGPRETGFVHFVLKVYFYINSSARPREPPRLSHTSPLEVTNADLPRTPNTPPVRSRTAQATLKSKGKYTRHATQEPPILARTHNTMCNIEHRSGHNTQLAMSGSAALLLCTLRPNVPTCTI